MIIKLAEDKNGNPIDTDYLYNDVRNEVSDIRIIEINGNYFAKPEGLDEEPLNSVCNGLIPVLVESEKSVMKLEEVSSLKL